MQQYVGYVLLPDCRYEKLLILLGIGRNGKSVVLRVLEQLVGVAATSNVPLDLLTSDAHLSDIVGKALVLGRDLNYLKSLDEARLKQLVSGEPLTYNRKYLSPITLRSHAKFVISTNELPNFRDTTDGLWRRMLVIPFDVQVAPEDVDPLLFNTLRTEMPGIFNWALDGLRDLLTNGFVECGRCRAVTDTHRQESDSVADFIATMCCAHELASLGCTGLYDFYRYFCDRAGRRPVGQNSFGGRMKRLGYQRDRLNVPIPSASRRPWVYRGLQLLANGRKASSAPNTSSRFSMLIRRSRMRRASPPSCRSRMCLPGMAACRSRSM